MVKDYLQRILLARVYEVAEDTSLDYASNLSRRLNHDIWLKREDEQPIFSFKLRGAYNKMTRLSRSDLDKGVVAASAGNHAQGVALAGRKLNCPVTIFMPVTSPQIKVKSVKALGAKVKLIGDSYAEAGIAATLSTANVTTIVSFHRMMIPRSLLEMAPSGWRLCDRCPTEWMPSLYRSAVVA